MLERALGALPAAHLAICAFCTTLLINDPDDGGYYVVAPETYRQLPADFRKRIQELAGVLETTQRPPGRLRLLLAARGDLFVAAVVYADGRMIASQPVSSVEEAGRILNQSEFVDLQVELCNPEPLVWLGRAHMEIFPGRTIMLGPWGPYGSATEAKRASTDEAMRAARGLGAIPLKHPVSEPRCQN